MTARASGTWTPRAGQAPTARSKTPSTPTLRYSPSATPTALSRDAPSAWASAPVILDVGGKTDGYIIPESGTGGLKFGSGSFTPASVPASFEVYPLMK